ncbi:MAG TPA: 3,4-dihydroxy-2-butanone-4-phosphate synthase, partial [Candidatus Nanoarchaeia archaeon]|nr:3,4-dihydroxy-2-butanone-4-phosphate synthase [Candidatus Nanoarchaeia archaeon]
VIVIDDKARENEGDLVIAAEKITPQKVNFMIKQAGGLICVPMTPKRLEELNLPLMTEYNTEFTKCAFTIPVDYRHETTTGISAFDRSKTILALSNPKSGSRDFLKPGHVFPLKCDDKGLKGRKGHTEASLELCRLSGLKPVAAICEIIGKNGKMAKLPELKKMAKKFNLKILKIKDLIG